MDIVRGLCSLCLFSVGLLATAAQAALPADARAAVLGAPLRFEPNRGQSDPQVRFLARGTGYGLFLTDESALLRLETGSREEPDSALLRFSLDEARPSRPRARLAQSGRSHYLSLDGRAGRITDVPHYGELVQRDRYPGIDVVWYGGSEGLLEYDFVLAPGADPASIGLLLEGAASLDLAANGDLHIGLAGRTIVQRAPVAFQYADVTVSATSDATRLRHAGAERVAVASRYRIDAQGRVRFELGDYDRSRPLVIDPVFAYGTFVGGSLEDVVLDIAVNAAGEVYATGYTESSNFPLANALDPSHGGGKDAFLLKLDATGSALLFSTFLGNTGDQFGRAVALDSAGRPYVAGSNAVSDPDGDAFVLRLNSAGNALEYTRTFGGSLSDDALALTVDAAGQAIVTGITDSTDFPTVNPIHGHLGARDCFFARLNAGDGLLNYSTYLGGLNDQTCAAVGYHAASGFAYVGGTNSLFDAAGDAFVTKLNFDASFGTGDWSRTVQISGADAGHGLAVDAAGNVWLVGDTESDNLPQLNALQGRGGGPDGFVLRYDAAGNQTLGSYLGGASFDFLADVALDASGRVHIAGARFDSRWSALVYRLAANGTSIQWQGNFGYDAQATGVASDGVATYLGGHTVDFAAITPGAYATVLRGGRDGWLAKLVEGTPNVRVNDRTVTEEALERQFTISVEPPSLHDIPLRVRTYDGSAVYTVDYTTAGPGSCYSISTWITAGKSTHTCSLRIREDTLDEDDEDFFLRISEVQNANVVDPEGRIVITDNDARPALSISDASTAEGDPCTPASAEFTVSLSRASGRVVEVAWATANGSAVAGSDYSASSGTLRFEIGETSKTLSVPISSDSITEGNESFLVNLTEPPTAGLADGQGSATIQNSPFPTIAIADASANEGTGAGGVLNFSLSSNPALNCAFSIDWSTANGSAGGADYVAASGSASFAANATSANIAVDLVGDTLDEPNETLAVNLAVPAWGVLADTSATGTILDDDAAPTLSVDNGGCTVTEGNSGSVNCNFVARLSAASGRTVSFNSTTANGSATAGSDYTAHANTARSIPAGQSTLTIAVPVLGDTLDEGNESFALNLSGVANATPGSLSATGTISDDDAAPTLSIDNGGCTVTEGNSGSVNCNFVVRLSAVSAQTVSFNSITANGSATAGADYTAHANTARSIPAGQSTLTIAVPVLGDTLDESNESFALNLSGVANATPGSLSATGTISDDDAAPTLSIDNGGCTVAEGNSGSVNCSFVARLSAVSGQTVSFNSITANGSATAGSDYTAHANTARSIPAGQSTLTIAVPVLGDTLDESNESFALDLSGVANATPGSLSATGTISDDDAAPTLSIDNGGCTVTEGNSGSVNCSFVARLSAVSGRDVSFTTGTANGTATAGSDYTAHSNIVRTLAAGQQTLSVLVPVLGDTLDEANESFALNFTAIGNATPGTLSGTGTILDDDEPAATGSLRVRDAALTVAENSGSVQIVVERVGGSSGAASVQYATANGTALAGLDYSGASGTLNWAAGDASPKTLTLTILFDPAVEPQESFTLNLSQASGASLGSPAAGTVTIIDGAQLLYANGFE